MKTRMRKIDLYITHQQYDVLKKESKQRGIPFSEMLRKMIDFYNENKSKK
jgi:hypothetical protein